MGLLLIGTPSSPSRLSQSIERTMAQTRVGNSLFRRCIVSRQFGLLQFGAPIAHHSSSSPLYHARTINRQSTTDQGASATQQSLQSSGNESRSSSDPTAKRPTTKCDPYGLAGQSLSNNECLDWLSTLEDGWKLIRPDNLGSIGDTAIQTEAPIFLQKQYYHPSFHSASQFLAHVTLLSTNINHYPHLSMERILVDDVHEFGSTVDDSDASMRKRQRKIKGWVFVSTIRCSTYRPPTKMPRGETAQSHNKEELYKDKGLTYHDFHLAMSIDIEANREEIKRLMTKKT